MFYKNIQVMEAIKNTTYKCLSIRKIFYGVAYI